MLSKDDQEKQQPGYGERKPQKRALVFLAKMYPIQYKLVTITIKRNQPVTMLTL